MTAAILSLAFALHDPPPGDAYRLPPADEIRSARLFNQCYQSHLRWRLEWEEDRTGELRAAVAEAVWLYEVWDCAEGAHPDYQCSPAAKACYLRRLRLLIGPDAYRRAELPPCVPVWRFNDLR